jgi:acetyl esterase
MPLHPEAQSFIDNLAEQNPPGWEDLGVDEAREVFETFEPMLGDAPDLSRIEDHTLPSGVRIRLYCDQPDPAPVVMFFHGGGWVLGNLDTHDPLCRRLAANSGCTVVAVEYGLSPENPFPGPVNDCYQATEFVIANASQLNVDASRIAVAGDSAGGHLATSVAIKARDEMGPKISLQVLMYPVIEPKFETGSYQEFADGFGLTRKNMIWFWQHFLDGQDPFPNAAPSHAESHHGLPPAIVVTAEYDVLRDEGNAYARRLQKDGVDVFHRQYEGMLHAFLHFAGLFDTGIEAGKEIAMEVGRRLKADHPRS